MFSIVGPSEWKFGYESTLKRNYYLVRRNRATPCSSLHNIERTLVVCLLLQLFRMSKVIQGNKGTIEDFEIKGTFASWPMASWKRANRAAQILMSRRLLVF